MLYRAILAFFVIAIDARREDDVVPVIGPDTKIIFLNPPITQSEFEEKQRLRKEKREERKRLRARNESHAADPPSILQ